MANSVQKNPQGPLWPLGSIAPTPGTPLGLMNNIDPTGINSPETATGTTSAEYTVRAQQIIIGGFKSNAGSGLVANSGNVYVIMKGTGSSNHTDTGAIVLTVGSGLTGVIGSAALNRNVFSPYELYIDCDTAGDAAQVTLVIQ
jgi:hypothetical protein